MRVLRRLHERRIGLPLDELLRRIADQMSAVSQGVGVEQLVLVRHACLWMASNRELLQPGRAPG